MMYSNINPAEIYSNTTWELLANDKYLKTTTGIPLSTGGSDNFIIQKTNLPSEKLQIESFQLGKGTQEITGEFDPGNYKPNTSGAFTQWGNNSQEGGGNYAGQRIKFQASRTWAGMSTPASPYTQNLGSGTAIPLNPTYITVKAWKRLT